MLIESSLNKNEKQTRRKKRYVYQNVDDNGNIENTKERFVDLVYPKDSDEEMQQRNDLEILFSTTGKIEEELNKDLYDFNVRDIDQLLYSLQSTTEGSINVRISLLKQYVDFCIRHGFRSNPINFFEDLNSKKYVSKSAWRYKYISKQQLLYICQQLQNYQLSIIPILSFMGVLGRELCQMRYLKNEDVDLDNKILNIPGYEEVNEKTGEITVISDKTLTIDDDFIPFFRGAMATSFIYNFAPVQRKRKRDIIMVNTNNPYLVKQVLYEEDENKPVSRAMIYNRFIAMKDYFKNEAWLVSKLTPVALEQSGMIEKLRQVEEVTDKVTTEDYLRLMEEYNKKPNSRYTIKRLFEEIRKNEEEEKVLNEIANSLED
ncbi:hypothetical protein G8V07_11425 [Clostridium botulinum D/C]|uniref:phage lytic cycle repressor MrpR family protein n=1 Tax=Clostridium botulinum TaxID=1491 RepID=UPI001E5E4D08|nr:hypothetical protein [Clostridium botulinum]MCD3319495.1 hypothetical protein [Clostridium botulinum D/C]MCD3324360.1 hypothetical protein [Clostridium botulinum D/C]MCD3327361.1 hypothetical protein [Clostridium botulinum D/C]